MLLYTFHYLAASLLIFQGTHALSETLAPMGVVPEEVVMEKPKAQFWGFSLFGFGALGVGLGLASHLVSELEVVIFPMLLFSLVIMAAYGCFIIFGNRKVDYLGKAQAGGEHLH